MKLIFGRKLLLLFTFPRPTHGGNQNKTRNDETASLKKPKRKGKRPSTKL